MRISDWSSDVCSSDLPDDFADALNGRIYTAMLRFAAVGKAATAVTLRPLFANDSEARYGAYLEDLVASPAVKSAVSSLAEQVSDFAARRMVRETIRQALDSLHDDQIGRATSRDRVCQYVSDSVVAVSLKKNTI